ncbi:MAG: sodium:solute symporter [Bacteroidia bacterium]|nr:sodium:solute symporter [Bacteroidia bacterium]
MSPIDWIVLLGTLFFIVIYGTIKSRGSKSIKDYLKGNNQMKWWTIGLSIMATQASAITFLSTPGLGYEEGMGFVQFYFGLPIALVLISIFFIPLYFKLKVYTAYEFLEQRFNTKTRYLAAFLFLVSRGLAAGITIYAPAIVLSQILSIDLRITILFIGILVIIYTVIGGTKAVSQTHKMQITVMMGGMLVALIVIFQKLAPFLSIPEAIDLAGNLDKMNVIDLEFNPKSKYNIWSGLLGGTFLALSYFGTDQSQVQRYISGKSIKEIRVGLMFNALLKVPMQFFILFIGVMVFVFYLFIQPPVFFNEVAKQSVHKSVHNSEMTILENEYAKNHNKQKQNAAIFIDAHRNNDTQLKDIAVENIQENIQTGEQIRSRVKELVVLADDDNEEKDHDFVFITFIMNYLPKGLIGLLIAVMFSAAMSSTSAELNSLASTTTIDFYKRAINKTGTDTQYLNWSKVFTLGWGILAIAFAMMAELFDNLVEAVNILGSLVYGTILGIFLVSFFFKWIKGNAVFISAIISQIIIIIIHWQTTIGNIEIAYLWYNLLAPAIVIFLSIILQQILKKDMA